MKCEYELGYSQIKTLLKLATLDELPAIYRLGEFRGSENDLRTAVAIYERHGETSLADAVRAVLR